MFGYRERLDGKESLYQHQDHSSTNKESESPNRKRTRTKTKPSIVTQETEGVEIGV
ncbi:hypothetical protein DAPPUDRAFT_323800 [Daphnia pulex]|uniref:Uncharacterized protein n=1 Tax=Daphnia pulex TaxID=6669 RepID=E9GZT7_DAPPU|nr:hypothetical protein DAPPUDRAFT_323800 [Daphnia pulex]|eukprot:EFX74867.1 hypothetical protein DAPPUDRAFT_323800 [Daphnia pulex]